MSARVEVTKKYAIAYGEATKKAKGRILDQVVEVTGWNRDHARQQPRRRLTQPKGRASVTVAVIDRRKAKPRKYSLLRRAAGPAAYGRPRAGSAASIWPPR